MPRSRAFTAAILPGLMPVGRYLVYIVGRSILQPSAVPRPTAAGNPDRPVARLQWRIVTCFLPLAMLIAAVPGSIMFGRAAPTEAAPAGGLALALICRALSWRRLRESVYLASASRRWSAGLSSAATPSRRWPPIPAAGK
ncbi:hypothetical protein [Rhodovulum sp. MB263]|uniref:hypothetical protein n=1 Tax=Rhodovulum sp. (strain MB263) TaxID=308754 RepID=UPI001E546726|nr:hypothetical protein [Rhodovulum sp. MB263]